jgi:heterotetrameric sarcosine oxidase gamma subunit
MSLHFLSPNHALSYEGDAPLARSLLHERARRAGARFAVRHGFEVASGFGPVAAEIAACQASAGIADQSYLGKLELQAPPAALAECVSAHTGAAPVLGTAHDDGEAWWCPLTPDRLLVLVTRAPAGPLRERLEQELGPVGGSVVDVTSGFAGIALAGPRARDVLARVTAIDVREASLPESGFRPGSVARVPALLLRERGERFLVLGGSAYAEYLWVAICDAGRPLGAALVGVDALERLDAVPSRGLARA